MREENDDIVTYVCDVCERRAMGRVYEVRPRQQQSKQPAEWFSLNIRHDHGQPRERLKAHVCSLDCATEQLRQWAA